VDKGRLGRDTIDKIELGYSLRSKGKKRMQEMHLITGTIGENWNTNTAKSLFLG